MSIIFIIGIGAVLGVFAWELTGGKRFGITGSVIIGMAGALFGAGVPRVIDAERYGSVGELLFAAFMSSSLLFILALASSKAGNIAAR